MEKKLEKKKKTMKAYEVKNLNNLKKYLKDEKNIDDIDKTPIRTIIKYIKEANYGESWKDNKLYALKSYCETKNRPTKLLLNESIKHTKAMKIAEKNQEQTEKEKENYLTYEELNMLMNIYKKYETKEDMIKYLILASICSDQPVLRPKVFATSKIIFNKKYIDNENNFIVLDKKNKKGYFYINDDKVSESEKFKDVKEIELYSEYSKIIFESIKKFPREYLFDLNVENKEIKLLNTLQEITELKFTFSMARSSFINHWYRVNPNATQNDIEKLCRDMRHSDETHRNNYKKVKEVSGNINKHSLFKKNKIDTDDEYSDVDESDTENDTDKETKKEKVLTEKYKKNAMYDIVYKANKKKEQDPEYVLNEETKKKYNIILGDDGKYKITKKEKKIVVKIQKQLKEVKNASQFNKRRKDVIRFANKRIQDGKEAYIKSETMLYYNIKYNQLKKIYE